MTLEEISNLTLEQTFGLLLSRIIDLSSVSEGERPFMLDLDDSKDFYDRVIMNSALVKPAKQLFIDELVEYKSELTAVEQARLDELARIKDMEDRIEAIHDVRDAFIEIGEAHINHKKDLKRIIAEDDQTKLSQLEAAGLVFKAKIEKSDKKDGRKKVGKKIRLACEGILDLIAGFNVERVLTSEQITQMETTFAPIVGLLRAGRPFSAKPLIEAITPDEVLVTQEMKDDILEDIEEINA